MILGPGAGTNAMGWPLRKNRRGLHVLTLQLELSFYSKNVGDSDQMRARIARACQCASIPTR